MADLTGGLIQAGTGLIGGIFKGIQGARQRKEGKRLLKGLVMPEEQLSPELTENQNIARTAASEGMPSEQYAKAMRDIQRNQLTAFRAAKGGRGGLGNISGILQGTNDASLDLNARNAAMRVDNQGRLINVNNNIASWKSKLFDLNKRQPYQEQRNYAYGLIGAGNQNLAGAFDQGVAGVGQGLYTAFGKPPVNNYYY